MSCDLLATILDECRGWLPADRGVNWPLYRRWVANRHDDGIRTVEQYTAARDRQERAWGQYRKFLREMGFRGNPNDEHRAIMQRWQAEWHFSDDIILKASAEAWGKDNPIKYANRILARWHERGITTLAEVQALLEAGATRRANSDGPNGNSRGTRPTAVNYRYPTEQKDDAYYEQFVKKFGRTKGEAPPGTEGQSGS